MVNPDGFTTPTPSSRRRRQIEMGSSLERVVRQVESPGLVSGRGSLLVDFCMNEQGSPQLPRIVPLQVLTGIFLYTTKPMCHQANASPSQCITKPMHHQANASPSQCVTKPMRHQANASPSQCVTKPIILYKTSLGAACCSSCTTFSITSFPSTHIHCL